MQPMHSPQRNEVVPCMDRCCIAAEEMIRSSASSSLTFYLYPNDTTLIINPPNSDIYFDLIPSFYPSTDYYERIALHRKTLSNILTEPSIESDVNKINEFLGDSFKAMFGIDFTETLSLLQFMNEAPTPPDSNSRDIPFVNRDNFIDAILDNTEPSNDSIIKVLDGIILTPDNLADRMVWKPQQEYRAFHRPIFAFPHETGPHLTWSKQMFRESILVLARDLIYKRIPPEWNNPESRSALARLSNMAGKWFENQVKALLAKFNIPSNKYSFSLQT